MLLTEVVQAKDRELSMYTCIHMCNNKVKEKETESRSRMEQNRARSNTEHPIPASLYLHSKSHNVKINKATINKNFKFFIYRKRTE